MTIHMVVERAALRLDVQVRVHLGANLLLV
jgi:hypothetical protein